ncbi:MAG: tetratricopeptide repeat protein [Alphaproteobacteria bacterium]|nr:tetratricopeptide repeat protein [Alphaproteobacteria bacterium]
MSKTDVRGNPVSHDSAEPIRRLDHVTTLMNAFQADPIAEVDALLAEHPDFVMAHAFRAGTLATAGDKAFESELAKSVAAAEALVGKANDRERLHIAAARAWLKGQFELATETWGRAALLYPRDITAIQFAQFGDFFLGYSQMLRDRVARVLPHWDKAVPNYGFLLGMHAFGLEECGDYAQAEATGREAFALDGRDAWAVHAVAHVMEMQGRAADGAEWLESTSASWAPNCMFGYHNWWHQALFSINAGNVERALKLFDEKISAGGFASAMELVDGSGLLWRLTALGYDVGKRWDDVADKWTTRAEDGYYAFNDLHAMMAFVGADRRPEQKALMAAAERAAESLGTNGMMTREIGLPALKGILAFGNGAYDETIERLLPVRGKANRFGGSHAQRDVFSWTLAEAALRTGDRSLAEGLIAERLAQKPESRVNLAWDERVCHLPGRLAA